MYKLGYTSGLAEAKCDEGKNTIKCVGDIVDKLAKKCEDVPKKMTMPSKITEVTDGCFSSAQIVKVCDEFSGNQSSDESQSEADSEAEEACDKAAKTSGSCGGGKSSKTYDKKDQSCKKSCCGGKSSSKNQRTGSKLVNMNVPTTIGDILASGVDEMIGNTNLTESQFKHLYCDNTPYPECETCPYNSKTFQNIERDIWSLFNMIDDAINELMCGRYDLANSMFRCPGQLNSLLQASLGPLSEVAAAAVTGSLIALTAARGAMAAFEGIATSARYTDFRREVMYSCGRLIKSGSLVGLPRQYASAINGILTDIGCSANTLCRITSKSGSARSSCFGNGYNLWGERPSGRKCVSEPYKSSGRPIATEDSKTKAEKALKIVDKSLKAAEDVEDNPYVAEIQDANEPTTRHKTYTETEDRVAESGKTYYRDVIDPKTGKNLPDGELGELVITTLKKQGAPLIRYRTHDLTRIVPGKCPCGREYPRIDVILGRTDDMVKVKGVNIFPGQIDDILKEIDGVSSEYQVFIDHMDGKDQMTLFFETECTGEDRKVLEKEVRIRVKEKIGLTVIPKAEGIGDLPRSEKKSNRIFDYRY